MTLIGLCLSNEKKKNMLVLKDFVAFNQDMLLTMQYDQKSIAVVAQKYKFVQKVFQGEKVTNEEEQKLLKDYLSQLGKTSSVSQTEYLQDQKSKLEMRYEQAENNYKKYGSLYLKIFFMAGILLAVLFA
jgi:stage III sporulation protein AB